MLPAHEKKFLHALALAGAEHHALEKLRTAFESYEAAWRASEIELTRAGLTADLARAIRDAREKRDPNEEMRKLVAEGIAIVTVEDHDYPKELRDIPVPPRLLYIKGRLEPNRPRLAVVGTRKATAYGREATAKIIRELADTADVVIVSGLAQGIDTQAHRAALDSGLTTIGILGSGMDRGSFFPYENWQLAEEMLATGGAVLSEYPPGTPALKHHFPARNRIIVGLAAGVLVAEAPERSGATISANHALEQGRDVFAIPGPLFHPNTFGVHRLIQDGAKLVQRADDIIEELNLPRRPRASAAAPALTGELETHILELLTEARSVVELKLATNLPTPEIISCLSLLELKGFIRAVGQSRYQRIA